MSAPNSNRMALFIDGANLYTTAKVLGFGIDYDRLLKEFQSRGTVVRAFFYTTIIEDQDNVLIRPLLDCRKIKGNIDIELTVDAMELADHIDEMVLFSGDGDFRRLVEAMQRRGVRVTVVSTTSTQPPTISEELRRQSDLFTDLIELRPLIARGLPT